MATLDIRLFGAVEIWCNQAAVSDFRSQKELVLLASLISVDRRVTREYLAGLAWPDVEHSKALGLLRRSLYDLNMRLSGFLDLDRHTVQLRPDTSITVDTRTFANLITQ